MITNIGIDDDKRRKNGLPPFDIVNASVVNNPNLFGEDRLKVLSPTTENLCVISQPHLIDTKAAFDLGVQKIADPTRLTIAGSLLERPNTERFYDSSLNLTAAALERNNGFSITDTVNTIDTSDVVFKIAQPNFSGRFLVEIVVNSN